MSRCSQLGHVERNRAGDRRTGTFSCPSDRDASLEGREAGRYFSLQGFPNNCLNPGVKAVDDVIANIFDEICELFPSRYVHIGADEVPEDAWQSSPSAKEFLKSIGGTGTADLQAAFIRRLQAFLIGRGKMTGAWDEAVAADGIDRRNCYLVAWQSVEAAQKLAADGFDVVVSPGQAYYLDMANGPDWAEPDGREERG